MNSKIFSGNRKILVIFFSLFLFLFSLNFVSSELSVMSGHRYYEDNGVSLLFKEVPTLKVGQNYTFSIHAYNLTGSPAGINQIYCAFHLYDSVTGNHLIENNNISFGSTDFDYFEIIDGNNFSRAGTYPYVVACISNNNLHSGKYSDVITVTPSGQNDLVIFLFFFLAIIIVTFILGIKTENNWVMIFGAVLVLLLGFWILIYGIDIIKDYTTTRAIGFIVWGLGIIALYKSVEGQLEEGFGR